MNDKNNTEKRTDDRVGSGGWLGVLFRELRWLGPFTVIGSFGWLLGWILMNAEPAEITRKRHADYARSKQHHEDHAARWSDWGDVKTAASFGEFHAHQARRCEVCGFAELRTVQTVHSKQ